MRRVRYSSALRELSHPDNKSQKRSHMVEAAGTVSRLRTGGHLLDRNRLGSTDTAIEIAGFSQEARWRPLAWVAGWRSKLPTVRCRGVAQPGSAPALGEQPSLPTAPLPTFRFQCFQQLGESAFAQSDNSKRVNTRGFATALRQPSRVAQPRRERKPATSLVGWLRGRATAGTCSCVPAG